MPVFVGFHREWPSDLEKLQSRQKRSVPQLGYNTSPQFEIFMSEYVHSCFGFLHVFLFYSEKQECSLNKNALESEEIQIYCPEAILAYALLTCCHVNMTFFT